MCVDRHDSAMVYRWRSAGTTFVNWLPFSTWGSNLARWQVSLSTDSFSGCRGELWLPRYETSIRDWSPGCSEHLIMQRTAVYNRKQSQQNVSYSQAGKDWVGQTTIHPSPLLARYMLSLTRVPLFKTARYCCEQLQHIYTGSWVICVFT